MQRALAHDRRTMLELALVIVVAAAARTIGLFGQSPIPDEAYTFWVGAHPLDQLLKLVRYYDVHPPLVYLLAHALFSLTNKAFEFRLLTSAAAVGGVVCCYFLARRIVGRYAWLAALLLALCPLMVFFDRFFRMYALLGALTALGWLLLLRALEAPQRLWRWAPYALVTAALPYTHYLAFFTVAGQALYVLALHRRALWYWAALAAAVAAWLPWLPAFLNQLPAGGSAFNADVGFGTRYGLAGYLLTDGLPYRLEFSFLYLSALWLLLLAAVVAVLQKPYRLAAWFLVPVLLQLAFTVVADKNLIVPRYLLADEFAVMIALSALVAALMQSRWRLVGAVIAAALLVLMTVGTADRTLVPKYMAVDWHAYDGFLRANLRPGDAIVFDEWFPWLALSTDPALQHRPVFLITDQRAADAAAAAAVRYRRVWFVDYGSQYTDPEHRVFRALRRTHPITTTWLSTEEGNLDFVVTTLFEKR